MASLKTKFSVGIFVAIGLTLALVAIVWLGMSHYFEKGRYYAAYFDESVQGLDKDSAVKYRGVSIGRVHDIRVAPDATLIQVTMKIESGLNLDEEEVVAQLKSVGITGIMFIELDRQIAEEPNRSPQISFAADYPVVATKPSGIKQFMEGIDDVLRQINSLDLQGISTKLKSSFDNLNQSFEDAQIKGITSGIRATFEKLEVILEPQKWNRIIGSVENAGASFNSLAVNANKTISGINKAVTRLERVVAENEKAIQEAIAEFNRSMKNTNKILGDGTSLIKNTNESLFNLQRHVLVSLQNIEKASANLNRFIEFIADQPSRLIFGEPAPSREIEPD
jgi:phospholipid/cholesterol/gamma-HCH transport system substrate-binding protein